MDASSASPMHTSGLISSTIAHGEASSLEAKFPESSLSLSFFEALFYPLHNFSKIPLVEALECEAIFSLFCSNLDVVMAAEVQNARGFLMESNALLCSIELFFLGLWVCAPGFSLSFEGVSSWVDPLFPFMLNMMCSILGRLLDSSLLLDSLIYGAMRSMRLLFTGRSLPYKAILMDVGLVRAGSGVRFVIL